MRKWWVGLTIATVVTAGRLDAEPPARKPLRLGIAGLSHSHVHGILGRAGTDVRIVGIAEPNREPAGRYAKRYGVDPSLLFASLEEMLEAAKPEAVAAFGPTNEHRAVVEACAPAIYPRVDDEPTIVLAYPRAQAILQASWNWPVSRKDIEVYGERGYVLAPDRTTVRLRRDESGPEESRSPGELPAPRHDPFAYLAAVVRGEVRVEPTDLSALANNVTVARILDAARESARSGRTVRLTGASQRQP